ncbi:glycosyltransferase [Sphingomonas sp. LHG3406-1]|uniref:glycosyltransferase n=1 Tax=Sphingomonas sp. LHG3406-1 TaxID=2804617 RepID=UPI0026121B47|nr:glycosyltransferase [Sphingomonas sp. LHG3406-1]
MAAILYLSYDGLTDPLGPSQVLAYLKGLSSLGHRISLITFEKPERSAAEREAMALECRDAGIDWHPQGYTRKPPVLSTLKDLFRMRKVAIDLHRRTPFDIVHCRSYPPALVGQAVQRHGARLLFDMRGFWADERVEGGLWKLDNPLFATVYRFFKRKEAQLLRTSDHIVSLTEAGRDQILAWRGGDDGPPVTVIPCCTDFEAFPPVTSGARSEARALLSIPDEVTVAAYLGSIGTWYMLDEMLDCFAVQLERDPGAVLLFVTRDAPGPIIGAARKRGISEESLRIRPASRQEVPAFLAAADYGLFFIRPTFSKQASSPVKLGELLALELPVLTNAGVGDMDRIMGEVGAGVSIVEMDRDGYARGLDALSALRPDMERWREARAHWFDLGEGVRRYDSIYRALGGSA